MSMLSDIAVVVQFEALEKKIAEIERTEPVENHLPLIKAYIKEIIELAASGYL